MHANKRLSHLRVSACICGSLTLRPLATEDLDDVAFARVAPVLQAHPALVAGVDFAHVVLEAAQRADAAVVDDLAAPRYTRSRATAHHPIADEAADNGVTTAGGGPHDEAHLGVAEDHLTERRLDQTSQRSLDVVKQVVDDLVLADLHTL